jgi:hypothetical protein
MKTTRKKKVTVPPQYVALQYKFSHRVLDATHYQLTSEPFELMPNELIIEKIREKGTINAATYARSPQRNNRHLLKTGIRTIVKGLGYGDQFEGYDPKGKRIKHFLIFKNEGEYLTVWHFKNKMPNNPVSFANTFLKSQIMQSNVTKFVK